MKYTEPLAITPILNQNCMTISVTGMATSMSGFNNTKKESYASSIMLHIYQSHPNKVQTQNRAKPSKLQLHH
jgi:hypothetical protein